MSKCSIFRDVFEKDNPKTYDIDRLLHFIKEGGYKDKIHQIRQCADKDERSRLKTFLPSICFSGIFKKRFDNMLLEHSGFVVMDLDHVDNLLEKKKEVCSDEYVYSCFISPSGDGLKMLIRIPPDKEAHRDYYRGLMQKYPQSDSTSINISRVCFISYDPEIYINKKSLVWDKKVKFEQPTRERQEAQETNYKKIDVAVQMVRNALDGEKHKTLIKASRLLGGYVAGGVVEEHEAIRVLEIEINKRDCADFNAAKKTICAGIEYGKDYPIYPENEAQSIKKITEEIIVIEGEPATDVIYLDDKVRESILYSFDHGTSRGETTHMDSVDFAFRMSRKELTVVHGLANHGKSAFALHLAMVKSAKDGHKWGVFSPENYPATEFYKDLVHTYIGKSTEKHHKNQMTRQEMNTGMDFVREYFYFMYPENNDPTPDYINMRFREMILKHNIDGCIIDPYNQLDTDISNTNGKEHLYLSKFLSKEKRFCVDHDVFFFILTHPKGDVILKGNNYDLPKAYSLSGGAMWYNKADNILVIHRPNFSNYEDKSVIFASQKIKKQKLNGIPSEVNLTFDRMTNRYYEENGYNPLDDINPVSKSVKPIPYIDFYNKESIEYDKLPIPQQEDDAPF